MYGNALNEAVNVKITQSLAPDPENDGSRRKLGSCTSSQLLTPTTQMLTCSDANHSTRCSLLFIVTPSLASTLAQP